MTFHSWCVYLILVLAACSTPGPAVIFIMTNAAIHGWKKAVFSALGNICGLLIMGGAAVAGLGALLETSEFFFNLIKYAGAAYLIYLGLRMFLRHGPDFNDTQGHIQTADKSAVRIYFQAFAIALSNPKAIIFLTALFPQFLVVEKPLMGQFILLIAVLMLFSFVFLMGYALLACRAKLWMTNPQRMKLLNRVSGSVFVGFGAFLTTTHR